MILRRATTDDAQALAVVHRTAMRVSLAFLPELHSAADDLRFFSETFLPANEVWVAETSSGVVGYVGFDDGWINHLYLLPEHQRQGIGPKLLALALADGRSRKLWTFQQNTRARKFYEDRGFRLIKLTDGAGNEENTPDALYEWGPAGAA